MHTSFVLHSPFTLIHWQLVCSCLYIYSLTVLFYRLIVYCFHYKFIILCICMCVPLCLLHIHMPERYIANITDYIYIYITAISNNIVLVLYDIPLFGWKKNNINSVIYIIQIKVSSIFLWRKVTGVNIINVIVAQFVHVTYIHITHTLIIYSYIYLLFNIKFEKCSPCRIADCLIVWFERTIRYIHNCIRIYQYTVKTLFSFVSLILIYRII